MTAGDLKLMLNAHPDELPIAIVIAGRHVPIEGTVEFTRVEDCPQGGAEAPHVYIRGRADKAERGDWV